MGMPGRHVLEKEQPVQHPPAHTGTLYCSVQPFGEEGMGSTRGAQGSAHESGVAAPFTLHSWCLRDPTLLSQVHFRTMELRYLEGCLV